MIGNSKLFSSLTPMKHKEYITFEDNSKGKVVSHGSIWVNENFILKDVALVSNLHFNLLSVSQLLEDDLQVHFKKSSSRVLNRQGDLVCRIFPFGQVFHVDFSQSSGASRCLMATPNSDLWKWHMRLGHLSLKGPCLVLVMSDNLGELISVYVEIHRRLVHTKTLV